MPKTKISEYSATANSNTDVASINIDEGCAPSGINNAIRAVMGHLKDFQAGTNSDSFNGPTNGAHNGSVGATTPAAGTFTSLSDSGNLTFTGTGNRITGDFSNATVANRVMFQTSTANTFTMLNAMPTGTGTFSGMQFYGGSDTANTTVGQIGVSSAAGGAFALVSDKTGAGTYMPMTFYIGGSERIRVDTSGNVGVGTSSPSKKLEVGSLGVFRMQTGSTAFDVTPTAGAVDTLVWNTSNSGSAFAWNTNSTERMRLDQNGNLLVGTTTAIGSGPTVVFKGPATAGQQQLTLHNPATSGTRFFQTFGTEAGYTERGYITWNGSTMALSNASDERLKKNIVNAPSALPKIAELKIRSFDFKEDDRHVDYGVIAQELDDVIPSAVFKGSETEDGAMDKPWSVGLEPLIPVLIKAIQEQQALINNLTERLTSLESQ